MKTKQINRENPAMISASEAKTLSGLFCRRIERTPKLPAYHQYDWHQKKWLNYSWEETGKRAARWQTGLKQEKLAVGDRVAVLLSNCIDWVCFEQAALSLGVVVVPLYTWDSPENIIYLLKDSGSRLLLTETSEQWHTLAPHAATLPDLQKIICLRNKNSHMAHYAGKKNPVPVMAEDWLPEQAGKMIGGGADPDDLATIVYTSGTTGPPKGVMLSHKNILWNSEAVMQVVPCFPADVLLSFLPLSHTFERTVGYYVPMMGGSSVAYTRSMQDLAEDMQIIRPTIIISVPRIYERIYAKVISQLEQKGRFARGLFQLTLDIGWQRFQATHGHGSSSIGKRILWPVLRRIVANKIIKRLGGRIRLAVSGGASLQENVSRFFLSLGLPLIQGYGLTEAAPVVSTNTLADNIPSSVGPPLPGVRCRLTSNKELLVKSPGLMPGYWNLPEKTGEAIDSEGWLHTGDVVEIRDQVIYIRGRIKEILVTSTGEKVPPVDLETAIAQDPLVHQVMVVGESRPYIGALLVLKPDLWEELARELKLDRDDPASLRDPSAQQAVLTRLEKLLGGFPSYARVHAVALLLDRWTIDNGLLTPTFKLKRHEIETHHAGLIRELYKGHDIPVQALPC